MTKIPIQVHVGEGLEAAGERFIDAWERAEQGIIVPERHIGFESYEGFA
jgi:hypothetical protein